MSNFLITICARGGSKGIPGKNIKLINGKPLITYSIQTALKFLSQNEGKTALSTDSDEIAAVAAEAGVSTDYRRPQYLATDIAGKIDVIRDIFNYEEERNGCRYEYIIDLDVTSPLRTVEDIISAIAMLKNDSQALNIFSVSPASRNPYFNMVEQKENGYYSVVKKGNFLTRQEAPKVFDMNASFYIYRRDFFIQGHKSSITGRSLIYEMPHLCFDLDEQYDFEFMSFLLENNKLNFLSK